MGSVLGARAFAGAQDDEVGVRSFELAEGMSNRVPSQAFWRLTWLGFQGVAVRRMALRMVKSLRMQATMTTFGGLPAAASRSLIALICGLYRRALWVAMYRAWRTAARPPQMERSPLRLPLSWLNGATPTSAAICLRPSVPSSGSSAIRVAALTSPMSARETLVDTLHRHRHLPQAYTDRVPAAASILQRMADAWQRGRMRLQTWLRG